MTSTTITMSRCRVTAHNDMATEHTHMRKYHYHTHTRKQTQTFECPEIDFYVINLIVIVTETKVRYIKQPQCARRRKKRQLRS